MHTWHFLSFFDDEEVKAPHKSIYIFCTVEALIKLYWQYINNNYYEEPSFYSKQKLSKKGSWEVFMF